MSTWRILHPVSTPELRVGASGDEYGIQLETVCHTPRSRLMVAARFAWFALRIAAGGGHARLKIERRNLTCVPN